MAALNLLEISGICALAAAALWAFRLAAMHVTLSRKAGTIAQMPSLRPAEIAYLTSQGNTSHTLTVLTVDVIQRCVKTGNPDQPPRDLAPYELEVWNKVRQFVQQKAEQKVAEVNPFSDTNPVNILRKLNAIKVFFTRTAARFIRDLIEDPRRIRKYFTVAGIARLVIDL